MAIGNEPRWTAAKAVFHSDEMCHLGRQIAPRVGLSQVLPHQIGAGLLPLGYG